MTCPYPKGARQTTMRTISVITPVYDPRPEHFHAAYESLRAQELPHGWQWEWILQEDGHSDIVSNLVPDDPRVQLGTGRRGGVALTRNLALARTSGELVKNLDQDDQLMPGTLSRDIDALTSHPEAGWATCRVLDLLPDGSTVGFDADPEPGILAPGSVVKHWRSHNYRAPVHPTTICIRRDLAIALGGWMAVPGSDDTGLLIAASVVSPGLFIGETGLLYRKWPGQVSAEATHTEPIEWRTRMRLISERADALESLSWKAIRPHPTSNEMTTR